MFNKLVLMRHVSTIIKIKINTTAFNVLNNLIFQFYI